MRSALWGLTIGLVAKSDTRYEEGVYYDTEPLYGNKFSLPYYSYIDSIITITHIVQLQLFAYDVNETVVDTITNVTDISFNIYMVSRWTLFKRNISETHMNDKYN